jgi:hypothetical protein
MCLHILYINIYVVVGGGLFFGSEDGGKGEKDDVRETLTMDFKRLKQKASSP